MGVRIRYMGAKHTLAPRVAEAVAPLQEGPCLDLFSGMCSVAGALAGIGRATWCNDIQQYATDVARAVTTATHPPPHRDYIIHILKTEFEENVQYLHTRFGDDLELEAHALSSDNHHQLDHISSNWRHAGNDVVREKEVAALRDRPETFPFRLATLTYAHGYFGLRQSIAIDSLLYAIHQAEDETALTAEAARWCRVAVFQTASHVVTAPGHFAQFLKLKTGNFERIRRQRLRNVWKEFLLHLDDLAPYGTQEWRAGNRVFREDALDVGAWLAYHDGFPGVIYADPPYSKAQYSRYYHVLETLARYDYPASNGTGRYRENRFKTAFSHLSGVEHAFDSLAQAASEMGADLVISYPSNGQLYKAGGDLRSLIESYYSCVTVIHVAHRHSTMGAAHGRASSDVVEQIFVARGSR